MALLNVLINIAANTASFESGMQRVESRLGALGDLVKTGLEFSGITLGLKELGDSFINAAQQGEQLEQLSMRLGESVEGLSQLQYAAKASNVPVSALTSSIDIFSRNLVQASEGSGKAKQALADLGIDAGKLAAIPLDQQLDIIADRIAALPNPTQQTAAAMRIFGAAGAELIPILRDGAAGLDALRQKSDDAGATIGGDTAEKLATAAKAIRDLQTASQSLWTELSADSAPALTGLAKLIDQTTSGFKNLTFGFSTPQAEMANLVAQATALSNEITKLNAGQTDKNWFTKRFGLDAGQIQTDTDALAALGKKIAEVQAQMDDTLEPVQVTARPIGTKPEELTDVQVTAQKTLTDYMQKYYNSLSQLTQTDLEQQIKAYDDKYSALQVLLADQQISYEEYLARVAELNDKTFTPIEVTAKYIGKITKTIFDDMQKYANSAAQSIQSSFATFLSDPTVDSFKKMGIAWLQTLDKMAADAAASQIFQTLFGQQGANGAGGLGGIMGALLGAVFGTSAGTSAGVLDEVASPGLLSLDGFANGGSFDVGGAGGTDSQLTAFWATPGEHVQVGGGGQSSPITIQNYVSVTSPQVTKADVLGAMQQTQTSTVSKLQDMKRRGQF